MNLLPLNPFTRPGFWGRTQEIHAISRYLLSSPPQCCALVGETSFGKTRLLRHLAGLQDVTPFADWPEEARPLFVYLDCISYVGSGQLGDYASARFWWDLYSAARTRLQGQRPVAATTLHLDQAPLDRAFELKSALEDLARQQSRPVVFLLDNFEGVARLPLRDSEWLRSLVQYPCAYVVASRHLLYLLYQYHAENWASPSPLWNIFSGPLYLGLVAENEAQDFLRRAAQLARQSGSVWEARDLDLLREMAGRHPELLRLACARLFELRQKENQDLQFNIKELIIQDALPTCQLLWRGLADPELWNAPRVGSWGEDEVTPSTPSPYQQVMVDLAHQRPISDPTLLYTLEQRGLIERMHYGWRVFSETMRQFVLAQAETMASESGLLQLKDRVASSSEAPPFTYLEERVYAYLKAHLGQVCDREEIKQAVWAREPEQSQPGNSALQKIIERIREKIEPDPTNPRYLIAVRGQGYILRGSPDSSIS